LVPEVEEPPAFVLYSGIVLGIVGLVVAVGLWILKKWSFWVTIIFLCSTSFWERRRQSWLQPPHFKPVS
jgi:hypothetical protein